MSDNDLDRLITERDAEGLSEQEQIRRVSERVRLIAVFLITSRDQKDAKIAALDTRLLPLETQMIGWKAQLALLIAQAGLAMALWKKSGM